MKPVYARSISMAALITGLAGPLIATPVSAQVARFRPLPLATPTPTPSATPTTGATPTPNATARPRIFFPTRPAPTAAAAAATPATGGRPSAPIVPNGRPAPLQSTQSAPTPSGRPAPIVLGGRPVPASQPAATGGRPTSPFQPVQSGRPTTQSPSSATGTINPIQSGGPLAPKIVTSVDANVAQIDATSSVSILAPAKAVTLRANSYSALLKSVPVVRRLSAKQLQLNPRLTLGRLKVDLTPVLTRAGGLPRVAQSLQNAPNLGRVNTQDIEVSEISQGLVIRSFLNYQLKSGVCADGRRSQVESMGLRCAARMTDQQRAAAFATPGNARYIADPQLRATILARAQHDSALATVEVAKEVANFRASLNAPATRQQIEAEVGAAEAQRLAGLSDEDLAGELINFGENKIEQVFYVPKVDSFDPVMAGKLAALLNAPPPAPPAPPPPPKKVTTDTALDRVVFLTGFTLGKQYEWSERVETSIKWCLIGCKKNYHAHVYANLSYGFGLRFPIEVGGNYHYEGQGANESATLTPQFKPINGTSADYLSTGLSPSQLFDGKELVAEAKAGAGFDAHIPIYPDPPSLSFEIGKDFTELLPAPFTNGQFTPPPAGSDSPTAKFIFDKFDLLGGRLNFGIIGAQVFPAVEIGLHSDKLTFNLYDEVNNTTIKLSEPGKPITGIGINATTHTSSFNISNPVYNVGFVITPGIDARLFIDLSVWSHTWDFPLWFPQLTVELPPGGVDFACHDGTICTRKYSFATIGGQTVGGQAGAQLGQLSAWVAAFDAKWLPQCADETCKFAIRLVRTGTDLYAKQAMGATDYASPAQAQAVEGKIAAAKKDAETLALKLVNEANVRQAGKAGDAWGILAQAVWTKQCKDAPCVPEISAIAGTMGALGKQIQAQNPDSSGLEVTGLVNKQVVPKFKAAIERSEARFGVQSIATLAELVWSKQCADALCRTNVTLIAGKMLTKAIALQKADPEMSGLELSGTTGKEFGHMFQAEVDASKARAAAPPPPRGGTPGAAPIRIGKGKPS